MGALSSDPDFRAAVREWEIATKPTGMLATSNLERDLRSQNRERRNAAAAVVAGHLARLILDGYRWSRFNPEETDISAALGRNMYAMIRWVSQAIEMPEEVGMGVESKVAELRSRPGEQAGTNVKGRYVSESIPPCWSPRWAKEREMLRLHSPAEMFEAELLNTIIEQLDVVDAGVATELAVQKKGQEPRNLNRAIDLQTLGLTKRLIASMNATEKRLKGLEEIGRKESKGIEALLKLSKEAKDKGWERLNRQRLPRPKKTPKEQLDAVGEWLGSDGGGDDDGDDGGGLEWEEYMAANAKPKAKKNPYNSNGRFTYGR